MVYMCVMSGVCEYMCVCVFACVHVCVRDCVCLCTQWACAVHVYVLINF